MESTPPPPPITNRTNGRRSCGVAQWPSYPPMAAWKEQTKPTARLSSWRLFSSSRILISSTRLKLINSSIIAVVIFRLYDCESVESPRAERERRGPARRRVHSGRWQKTGDEKDAAAEVAAAIYNFSTENKSVSVKIGLENGIFHSYRCCDRVYPCSWLITLTRVRPFIAGNWREKKRGKKRRNVSKN